MGGRQREAQGEVPRTPEGYGSISHQLQLYGQAIAPTADQAFRAVPDDAGTLSSGKTSSALDVVVEPA